MRRTTASAGLQIPGWASYPIRALRRIGRIGEEYRQTQQRHHRLVMAMALVYCAVLGTVQLYTKNWPTPDQIGLALFAFALLTARPLSFLRDWAPFVVLLLSYEALRGHADGLVAGAAIDFPIEADRAMFGTLPTVWLQEKLWDPQNLRWWDYFAAWIHPMHFLVPLALAFAFWVWNKVIYWKFVASYLLLTYAGYVTYVLYPMAPPWYAANMGRIPDIDKILGHVLWRHSVSHPVVIIYDKFEANPVAAMPSLHAAFPVLVFCIVWYLWPKFGWLSVLYPIGMNFSVVYMGEHYVIDVLVGGVYGAAAFAAVWLAPGWVHRWWQRRQETPVVAAERTEGPPRPVPLAERSREAEDAAR